MPRGSSIKRLVADVARQAKRQGWRVEIGGRDHWKFYAPNGRDLIVTGGTSRSVRGFRNFLADMRRAGYVE